MLVGAHTVVDVDDVDTRVDGCSCSVLLTCDTRVLSLQIIGPAVPVQQEILELTSHDTVGDGGGVTVVVETTSGCVLGMLTHGVYGCVVMHACVWQGVHCLGLSTELMVFYVQLQGMRASISMASISMANQHRCNGSQ